MSVIKLRLFHITGGKFRPLTGRVTCLRSQSLSLSILKKIIWDCKLRTWRMGWGSWTCVVDPSGEGSVLVGAPKQRVRTGLGCTVRQWRKGGRKGRKAINTCVSDSIPWGPRRNHGEHASESSRRYLSHRMGYVSTHSINCPHQLANKL